MYHKMKEARFKMGTFLRQHITPMIFCVAAISLLSILNLFSAGNVSWHPYALSHLAKILLALLAVYLLRRQNSSWLFCHSYTIYGVCLGCIVLVYCMGTTGLGAKRWLNLYILHLQPSELMKIGLILALSRFACVHHINITQFSWRWCVLGAILMVPVIFVLLQPDLGTALVMLSVGIAIFLYIGIPRWVFLTMLLNFVTLLPIMWHCLHRYQQQRIITFLNPSSVSSSQSYQINQSCIAVGSGGVYGRGLFKGTQGHLGFLPEKHTDFAFAFWCEEWGLLGGVTLIMLYIIIITTLLGQSIKSPYPFTRLVCYSAGCLIATQSIINIAMCLGWLPVVGVPLPFFSYGGTSLIASFLLIAMAKRD